MTDLSGAVLVDQVSVLSLFSGIGGLDLGLERAGMTIAGQVEIDPWCRKVLAKHWPEVPRHDDVRTCAAWWGERTVDLVCGGFPCQPVSLAGKREGQADSRWLWPAFAAVVRALRPRYVVVENTPGLTSLGMGDVVGDLAALGYDAEWDCIPACWLGAPHIRERILLVAHPAGIGRVGADDRQREHAAQGRAGRPAADDDWLTGEAGSQPGVLANAAGARCAPGQPGESRQVRVGARRPQPERLGGDVADADRGRLPQQQERDGEPQSRIFASSWYDAQRRHPHAADAARQPLGWPAEPRRERGHWAAEPGVGRVAHGIPARVDRLRGLGNAVVPQVAEHIGRLIMSHLAVAASGPGRGQRDG